MKELYANDYIEMEERLHEILNKYGFTKDLLEESYVNLLLIYHSMCENQPFISSSEGLKKVNEYANLLRHLRNSSLSETFELTIGGIRHKYSVEIAHIIEIHILEEFNKMVYKDTFNFESFGVVRKVIGFKNEGLEDYAIYYGKVDEDFNKDVWTDEDLSEIIKFYEEREVERMVVEGRMGSRRFELGFWANEMIPHFPKNATKVDVHNCIYDLMLDSGFLNFNIPSQLALMNSKDRNARGTMVRDWIRDYRKSKHKLFIFNEE